ncbi:hypothetical protein A9P82_06325 [Arachidicoccus ginsenosidimutans]|uniref:tetratricopeptide repeat protein n=1 Tax=Arachidicoccus sp. BS20 TaxID=1850526 RepID=UPI0007F0FE65|nr:tetratricopeptide repeat protein [Arachidicoccus sp. BS20]ANI88944.1 hypothetical protein A9P82_06325 [Arachidicoccus sp. BS20]
MKKYLFIFAACFAAFTVNAQNNVKGNKEVFLGNKAYDKGDLKTAQSEYQKALKLSPNNWSALANLGIVQSKLKNADGAVKSFDNALTNNKDVQLKATLNYDKGTTLAKAKKYEDAIKAFKNSLRINPEDQQARENLQKAINELKQQNQKNQNQNKDQNKNKNQQQKQNDKQQQKQDKNKQQQKQQQQQNQMSKEQAEQLLKALRQQEKETQQKLDRQKAGGGVPKNGKDW